MFTNLSLLLSSDCQYYEAQHFRSEHVIRWDLGNRVPRPLSPFQCYMQNNWEWPGDEANSANNHLNLESRDNQEVEITIVCSQPVV